MIKVQIKPTGKPMSHMEQHLVTVAKQQIQNGADILFLRLFLEEELKGWKRDRIKYRNAATKIEASGRDIFIKSNAVSLVQFIPLV